jgi:hypothetical protein
MEEFLRKNSPQFLRLPRWKSAGRNQLQKSLQKWTKTRAEPLIKMNSWIVSDVRIVVGTVSLVQSQVSQAPALSQSQSLSQALALSQSQSLSQALALSQSQSLSQALALSQSLVQSRSLAPFFASNTMIRV